MKVVHGSLSTLLQEVKDRNVDAVRVAAFVQSDGGANGIPRYTAWVVVTAVLDVDRPQKARNLRPAHLESVARAP